MNRDFPGLDAIRFAAALLVTLYHLTFWWWLPASGGDPAQFAATSALHPVTRWGWVGVQIFFVLSGFVIAYSADGKTAVQFFRNRALRLYPAAWLCATVTLLVTRLGQPGAWADYGRSLILSPIGPWISGVYWTLALEVVFYAYVGLTLSLKQDLRRLATVLALIGSGYWLVRAGDFLLGNHLPFEAVDRSWIWNLSLLPSACFFALGMLLWSISKGNSPWLHWCLAAATATAGALATFNFGRALLAVQGGSGAIIPALIWVAAVAFIAANIRWNETVVSCLGPFRSPLRTLGLMTYPLYLVHSDLGRDLALALGGSRLAIGGAILGVVALSWALLKAESVPRALLAQILPRTSKQSG